MRVLAALSGGVDSAVAAARAVDAGHDVVVVHMALTRERAATRCGSRGCCDGLTGRRNFGVIFGRDGDLPAGELPLDMGKDVASGGQGIERRDAPARFSGNLADIGAGERSDEVWQFPKPCQ